MDKRRILAYLNSYFGTASFFLMTFLVVVLFLSTIRPDVFSIYLTIISTMMVAGLFAIFFPYNFSYYLCLATALLSPAFSILVWFTNKGLLESPIPTIVVLPVAIGIAIAHLQSYKKNLIKANILEIDFIILLFFLFSAIIVFSNPSSMNQTTADMMFIIGIGLFIVVSLQIVNMAFRRKLLNERFETQNWLKLIEQYRSKLRSKSEYDQKKVDFILYYLAPSLEDFIFGNFERSFENGFKIVFDGEFNSIHEIVNHDERRRPFAAIRNTLAHARAESADIESVEDIKRVKKGLFDNTLNLLGIVNEFMDASIS